MKYLRTGQWVHEIGIGHTVVHVTIDQYDIDLEYSLCNGCINTVYICVKYFSESVQPHQGLRRPGANSNSVHVTFDPTSSHSSG